MTAEEVVSGLKALAKRVIDLEKAASHAGGEANDCLNDETQQVLLSMFVQAKIAQIFSKYFEVELPQLELIKED